MTQEFLQDAMVKDLKTLFEGYNLKNSLGVERAVQIYAQDTPIREGEDETPNPEAPPEPYIVVRLLTGELPEQDSNQTVKMVLVICVCDFDKNRQGYRDALHIVNEIMLHYGANRIVANRYEVQYPIQWTTQEEDTHPYYFAGVALNFEASAIFEEVPEI